MPLENNRPYIKVGLQGFAGSGKTFTAVEIALGLHKQIGSKKPIACFDTEKAIKALKWRFDERKVSAVIKESRTLPDLENAIKVCHEGAADILIIDSITHVWENFLRAYIEQKERTQLQFQDWGVIKPLWRHKFSDPYVTSNLHIIFSGRAGYEYEEEIVKGKREIHKSGIKMKAETETPYEPDLLIYMERVEDILGDQKKIWREATILKDRTTLIDGKTFDNPTYKDFQPFMDRMLAGQVVEVPASEEIQFKELEIRSEESRAKREIQLDRIKSYFDLMKLGTGKDEKALKIMILMNAFDTGSWAEIERKSLQELEKGCVWIEHYKNLYLKYLEKVSAGVAYDIREAESLVTHVQQDLGAGLTW